MRRGLYLLLVLLLAVGLVFLGSCRPQQEDVGEDDDDDDVADVTPGEPQYGGTLTRAAIYGDAESLDPYYVTRVAAIMHLMNMFDGLIRLSPDGIEEPAVAEDWEISPDGLVYTFNIRQGVKFHHGREVTAHDVEYSLYRVMDPANATPHMMRFRSIVGAEEFIAGDSSEIEGIRVLDDYTIQLELVKVDNTFLRELTTCAGYIVPQDEVERLGDRFAENPVGCGPFKFEKWVKDSEIVMVAFDDYWEGRPYLDEVVARIIREPATREMEFEAGRVDMYVLNDPQYARIQDDPRYKDYLVEVPELFLRHIGFNNQVDPLTDVRVRQAINYAIDRWTIIDRVLHGKAYPAYGWYPPTNPAYNEDIVNHAFTYDPDKARDLLEEAGLGDGFSISCLTTDHAAWGLPALEAAMGYLDEVGITVVPELQEGAVVLENAYQGTFEMYMHSFGIATPLDLVRRAHSDYWGHPGNPWRYSNETVDSLLMQATTTVDYNEMISLLQEAELIVLREAPLWYYNYNKAVMLHQPWVNGVVPIAQEMDYQPLHKIWLSPR